MRVGVQFQYECPFIWPNESGLFGGFYVGVHPWLYSWLYPWLYSVWPSSQDLGLPPHYN